MQIMLYYIGYYNQHLSRLTERVKCFSRNAKKIKRFWKSSTSPIAQKRLISLLS